MGLQLAAALLLPAALRAQALPAALHVDHLTISDGLSHNTVHCLLQDRHGFFWIGTQLGLNKYDGYSFDIIRNAQQSDEPEGLDGQKITALFEDRAGNLWVGTGKSGIHYRAARSDRFVSRRRDPAFSGIGDHEITAFFEDRAGHLWITTIGAGLLRHDPASGNFRHFTSANSGLSSEVVFDVVEDSSGTIWVATAGGGLNVLGSNDRFELSHPMLPNHPNLSGYHKKLRLDGEFLWIGTEGTGLYQMNLRDRSYQHFAPGNGPRSISSHGVRDMFKTSDGKWFIATDGGGLNVYDPASGEVTVHRYEAKRTNGLNSDALFCFWGDRTGNIWIGTFNGGLNIYKPGKVWFERFAPDLAGSETLQNRSILSLLQSRDGSIWVGSDGGGLNRISAETSRFSTPPWRHDPSKPGSLGGNVVKALLEDNRQRLWVGLFGNGLCRLDAERFEQILGPPLSVWSMAARKEGQLWIATMGDGIVVLDPETLARTHHRHDPGKPGSLVDLNVMVVFVDREDRVWAGTMDQGLELWDEQQQAFRHYRHDPGDPQSISSNAIRAIFQDSKGRIWIGTEGGGLNKWTGEGTFERLGKAEGLVANSVMGIAEDQAGMLWVTTFEGISRLDPESGMIRNFDFRTAERANQFNQSAILAASNGKLFFGGTNGLNTLHPGQLSSGEQPARVIFTRFSLFNHPVSAGLLPDGRMILDRPIEEANRIHLRYSDKSFSFSFSAIDFTSPLDHRYACQMVGFDKEWQELAPGQNSVSYTNLDPGSYTFRVRCKDQIASIEVVIDPPFWQTIWFRLLAALLFLGTVSAIFYEMTRRREAAHKRQVLQLQNEKLASEVESKASKLMFSAIQMAHKNEILSDLKQDLLQTSQAADIRALVRKLDAELRNEDHWKEFDIYFNQVDQEFFQSLLHKHPDLTQNDLRMCSLIRINLSTKEIAFLLNISPRAVEQGRYRLKKRLGLDREDDLNKYITGFRPEGLS